MNYIRFYSLLLLVSTLAFAAEIAQVSFSGLSYTPLTTFHYPQQGWKASFDFSIGQSVSVGDYFELSMAHIYRLKFDNDESIMIASLNDGTQALQCYVTQQAAYLYEDTIFRCEATRNLPAKVSGSISFSLSFSNGGSAYTYELQNAKVFKAGVNEVQLSDKMSAPISFDGYNFNSEIYTIGRTTTHDSFESYYLGMSCADGYLLGGTQTINYDNLNKGLALDCSSAQVYLSDNFNDWSLPISYEKAGANIACSANTLKVSLNESNPNKLLWINALQKVEEGINTIQHDVQLEYSCSNTVQRTIETKEVHTIVEYTIYQGSAVATLSQSSSAQDIPSTVSCSRCSRYSSDSTTQTSQSCSKCSGSSTTFSSAGKTSSGSCSTSTPQSKSSLSEISSGSTICTACHHSESTTNTDSTTSSSSASSSSKSSSSYSSTPSSISSSTLTNSSSALTTSSNTLTTPGSTLTSSVTITKSSSSPTQTSSGTKSTSMSSYTSTSSDSDSRSGTSSSISSSTSGSTNVPSSNESYTSSSATISSSVGSTSNESSTSSSNSDSKSTSSTTSSSSASTTPGTFMSPSSSSAGTSSSGTSSPIFDTTSPSSHTTSSATVDSSTSSSSHSTGFNTDSSRTLTSLSSTPSSSSPWLSTVSSSSSSFPFDLSTPVPTSSSILPSFMPFEISTSSNSFPTLSTVTQVSSCSSSLNSTCTTSTMLSGTTHVATIESTSCNECQTPPASSDYSHRDTMSSTSLCETCFTASSPENTSSKPLTCIGCSEAIITQSLSDSGSESYVFKTTTSTYSIIPTDMPDSMWTTQVFSTSLKGTELGETTTGSPLTTFMSSKTSIKPMSLQPTPLVSESSQSAMTFESSQLVYEGAAYTNDHGTGSSACMAMLLLLLL